MRRRISKEQQACQSQALCLEARSRYQRPDLGLANADSDLESSTYEIARADVGIPKAR